MPGVPRETANIFCNCRYSRGAAHMCPHNRGTNLPAEEQKIADESLAIYCKPVELYNILQRRAVRNPTFLQRCLCYKIQAEHKKRIQMTVSLPSTVNDESGIQTRSPLHILLARPVYSPAVVENSEVYHFSRACILIKSTGLEGRNQDQAKFILPEFKKLSAEVKFGSLSILFVSCAELFKEHVQGSFPANVGGSCFFGKIPMELLHLSWENSPNLSAGGKAEMLSTVDLQPCFIKTSCFGEEKCISFQNPHDGVTSTLHQLQVSIVAEEFGAKERSPYDSFSYNDIPSTMQPHIMRLRTGNVVFNYRYYNNQLHRTEVTEDFTCPFCLMKCASFKGLRYHLPSSHDLFSFEFWVTEEFHAVNVSVKTCMWRSEIVAARVDLQQQTFFFCSKAARCRKLKSMLQRPKHLQTLVIDSEVLGSINELQEKIDENGGRDRSSPQISSATANSYAEPECVQSVPGSNLVPPALLHFAKTRKLSIERSEPRNRALLQKRQFFHSHRAQPMAMEQVLSDCDSEDEVDDDVADLVDRRMLDDFLDVTNDEKQFMHLWNSFVRKQRVLADGHIPWAYEAFSKLHGQNLVQTPALQWCWRLFMIKLWNHGILDARIMNNCSIILEQFQNQDIDP